MLVLAQKRPHLVPLGGRIALFQVWKAEQLVETGKPPDDMLSAQQIAAEFDKTDIRIVI